MELLSAGHYEVTQPLQLNPVLCEYLAGFFDVSGSITIEKSLDRRPKNPTYRYTLRAEIEKVSTGTIDLFKNLIPSYDSSNRSLPSGKITDRWLVKARKARLIMETLGPHLRIKAGHWDVIQEYLSTIQDRPIDDSERLKEEIEELNKNPKVSFAAPFTDPYIAGVFDGHGSIDIHSQEGYLNLIARIGINIKSFMEETADYLDASMFPTRSHGHIKAYVVALHSDTAADFLRRIQPYSIRHRSSIPLALKFQDIWGADKKTRRSGERMATIENARRLFIQTRGQ